MELSKLKDIFLRHKTIAILVLLPLLAFGAKRFQDVIATQLDVDNIRIDANTISSTDTNGNIILNPDGSGGVQFPDLTTDSVPYVDGSGNLVSSSISQSELETLEGQTALITEGSTSTFTNKTIDADNNTISNLAHGSEVDNPSSGVHGVTGSVVGTTDTQTLTNKTLTSPSINTQMDFLSEGALRFQDNTGGEYMGFKAPATLTGSTTFTLPDGDGVNGQAIVTNGTGTLSWANAGGGGAGGVSYWSDFQADNTAKVKEDADYNTYAGTPDNAASNLSIAAETTNPLSGDNSYSLVKAAADASDEAWILPLENPDDDTDSALDRLCTTGGQTVNLSFKYETSANYDNSANERMLVYTYGDSSGLQACSARDILSGDFTNQVPIAPDGGQYQCVFSCALGDTAIDAVLAYSGTATNAVTFTVDEVKIGPDSVITAPIVAKIADDEAWTDNWANATTSVDVYRDGKRVYVIGKTSVTGSVSESDLDITIPTAYTHTGSALDYAGNGSILDSGTQAYIAALRIKDADELRVLASNASGTYATETSIGVGAPFTWVSGDQITWQASWDVSGWADSAILSTTQVDHSVIIAKYESDAAQSIDAASTEVINFEDVILDTHSTVTTGASWVFTAPRDGRYFLEAGARYGSASWTANDNAVLDVYVNGSQYDNLDAFTFPNTASYQPATWTGSSLLILSAGDTVDVRISNPIGSAVSLVGNTALVNIGIYSLPDFSTFSTHGVFEVVSAESSVKTPSASAHYHNHTGNELELTAGTWQLSGEVVFSFDSTNPAYTSTQSLWLGADGADSGATPAALTSVSGLTVESGNSAYPRMTLRTAGVEQQNHHPPTIIITLTETATVYLGTYADLTTPANARITVHATAKRLK